MQISIPLNSIQFEVRDGKLIFCPSESVKLASYVLDAIDTDLRTPTSEVYEVLADRRMISSAMEVAENLDALDRASADRELTDDEIGALSALRGSPAAWVHRKAGQILCQDAVAR